MSINKIMHSLVSTLCLTVLISVMSSNALAFSPAANSNSDCISKKKIYFLIKSAFLELKRIDKSLTLTNVKTALKPVSKCITIEEFSSILNQYKLEITENSLDGANTPPLLSGSTNSLITAGGFYIFTPTVDDPDKDNHFFAIKNLPDWAVFDVNTGTILGVPLDADTGLYENIIISVFDGIASNSLAGFSIEVIESQSKGIESPLLKDIVSYSFNLGVSKSNLDTIIDLDTGSDIQSRHSISIADMYYYTVIARDVNGNKMIMPKTEIGGYRIYLGSSSDKLTPITNLEGGPDMIYWANQLLPGTYFLSISTFDVNGNESALSNMAQFDLN